MNPIEERFLRRACPHLFRHIDKPKGFPESEKNYYRKNTLPFLNGQKSFPGEKLPVKSTPWTNQNGLMKFGFIKNEDRLTVYTNQGQVFKKYRNQEELINEWTVD